MPSMAVGTDTYAYNQSDSSVRLLTSVTRVLVSGSCRRLWLRLIFYDVTLNAFCLRAIATIAIVTNTANNPHNCSHLGIMADQPAPN